ncbi:hypothetical protein D3C85_1522660 [compost metagenome]
MERTPRRQAIRFLSLKFVQRLLNAAVGLIMHAAALVQNAIDRCLADARLGGDLLDGKVFGTFEHRFEPEVFVRSFWALLRLCQC